jgi:hypothetical protein
MVSASGTGAGFGAGRLVEVSEGKTYVLSAFFYTEHAPGHIYMDLGDVSFEPYFGTADSDGVPSGIPNWQFAYASFTVPADVVAVRVRVNHDHRFAPGDSGYIDDIAITPVSEFAPPIPLPVIQAIAMINREPRLTIAGLVGQTHVVLYSDDLAPTGWKVLAKLQVTQSPYVVFDVNAPLVPNRFYEVKLQME